MPGWNRLRSDHRGSGTLQTAARECGAMPVRCTCTCASGQRHKTRNRQHMVGTLPDCISLYDPTRSFLKIDLGGTYKVEEERHLLCHSRPHKPGSGFVVELVNVDHVYCVRIIGVHPGTLERWDVAGAVEPRARPKGTSFRCGSRCNNVGVAFVLTARPSSEEAHVSRKREKQAAPRPRKGRG